MLDMFKVQSLSESIDTSNDEILVIKTISCPSVRPSVTLVDCDHTRWNSAKIISRLISLGTWLSTDTKITVGLLQREHP